MYGMLALKKVAERLQKPAFCLSLMFVGKPGAHMHWLPTSVHPSYVPCCQQSATVATY